MKNFEKRPVSKHGRNGVWHTTRGHFARRIDRYMGLSTCHCSLTLKSGKQVSLFLFLPPMGTEKLAILHVWICGSMHIYMLYRMV